MPSIDQLIQQILEAEYGEEVRGSIAEAIRLLDTEIDEGSSLKVVDGKLCIVYMEE